ncbi:MAG: shikimate kinase, partial [Thermodesulfobacteriota bacterium]
MDKIILIGFRCTGKTTIGKKLAEVLNWKFLDLDVEIQKKTGKTIKEMVEEKGWDYFRKLEKEEMKKLKNIKNAVIALGGGSVIHQEEMEKLLNGSLVIWLYSSPEVILERIRKDEKTALQRPPLK